MSFDNGVFIEATVGVVTAKRYWKVQRSGNPWSVDVRPFFAGPIVAMVRLRWVEPDDPKLAANIEENIRERQRNREGTDR